ncbi:MAG TPA: hypothetical protein VGI46_00045 [Candidatus Acidoferrum sp.]
MPNDQLRNRTVGSKVTESEYARLSTIAERRGVTLGEWCREVLLACANDSQEVTATAAEQALFAEVVALRTILLNALYKLAPQEDLSDRDLDQLIERADKDRFQRARQRLAAAAKGGKL